MKQCFFNLKKCFVALTSLAVCVTACVNSVVDEEEELHLQEGSVPITFSGKVSRATTTRVADKALELGDKIGLMAMLSGTPVSGQRYINNLLLNTGAENTLVPERVVYYPEGDDAKLDFVAYYPYRSEGIPDGGSVMAVSVKEDQSSKENWNQSDFLIATKTKVSASTNSVTLTFKHKLAKLKVELIPETPEGIDDLLRSNPSLYASGFYTQATYDFTTDKFSNLSKGEDAIQASGTWKKSSGKLVGKELIVVPQEISQNEQYLVLEVNGKIYTCQLTDAVLNSNSQRVITVRVKEAEENEFPGIVGEVEDWTEGSVQEEESETNYQLTAVQTSFLSFGESNVYRLVYAGAVVAEVCKEYLRLPDQDIDEQAIVVYPVKDGKTDLMQGTVLELLGVTDPVHGGQIQWNTETKSVKYTPGTSAPIRTFYLDGVGKVVFEKPSDALTVHMNSYLLQDIRGTEVSYYGVVKIGTQYWMQDELFTTRYTDGRQLVQRNAISNDPGYYREENGTEIFYNGPVLQQGEMAPIGWRIPKVSDWNELVEYVGGVAALKAGEWTNSTESQPVTLVTNRSCFNVYPIGMFVTRFLGKTSHVAFWSLNEDETDVAEKTLFLLSYSDEPAFQPSFSVDNKGYKSFAIRCLRK